MAMPGDRSERTVDRLPPWGRVLVVVAHPDDESFALGALISGFVDAGARVSVLCLTRGEASTLLGPTVDTDDPHVSAAERLAAVRAAELTAAAEALGVASTRLADLPDGRLSDLDDDRIVNLVRLAIADICPDGLLVFDPARGVTGHADHAAASCAAVRVAEGVRLPALGWALPSGVAAALNAEFGTDFHGYDSTDLVIDVDRGRQRRSVHAHASQAVPGSVLWRRLELLGPTEHLRWLVTGP